MTAQHPPFFNFNQMLVLSVLVHLVFLSVLMYLPKPNMTTKRIQPAFMVDLVELPRGRVEESHPKPAAKKASPEARKETPSKPKPVAAKPESRPTAAKSIPLPDFKPIEVKPRTTSKSVAEPFPDLSPKPGIVPPPQSADADSLVRELDELARLKKSVPNRKPVNSNKPVLDQTFRELDALKTAPANPDVKPNMVAPVETTDPLQDFNSIRMENQVLDENQTARDTRSEKKLHKQEIELERLLQTQAAAPKQPKKTRRSVPAEVTRELEELKKMKTPEAPALSFETPPTPVPESLKTPHSVDEPRIVEKLAALPSTRVAISLDVNQESQKLSEFKSEIHNLKDPGVRETKTISSQASLPRKKEQKATASSDSPGKPGADVLSLYIGEIRQKVLANWKDPLGAAHSRAQASFYIFPKGNIGKPALIQSSGDPQLDILALRAIKEAAPFPEFPKELREPNLLITINFDYVQKK